MYSNLCKFVTSDVYLHLKLQIVVHMRGVVLEILHYLDDLNNVLSNFQVKQV